MNLFAAVFLGFVALALSLFLTGCFKKEVDQMVAVLRETSEDQS